MPRRDLPGVGRQVRKELPNRVECVALSFDFVVDGAASASMNVRAAKLLLGDYLAHSSLHDRRARHEKLADPLDHYREVRSDHPCGAKSRDRAKACSNHRHFREHRDNLVPGGIGGNVSALHLLERFDASAAPCSVDEADDGYPLLAGE